jgi:hypothetical protein
VAKNCPPGICHAENNGGDEEPFRASDGHENRTVKAGDRYRSAAGAAFDD